MFPLAVDLGDVVERVRHAVDANAAKTLFGESFPQLGVLLADGDFLRGQDQQPLRLRAEG